MVASHWIEVRYYSSCCDETQDSGVSPGVLDGMCGCTLSYSVYLDNPVENLVFHSW